MQAAPSDTKFCRLHFKYHDKLIAIQVLALGQIGDIVIGLPKSSWSEVVLFFDVFGEFRLVFDAIDDLEKPGKNIVFACVFRRKIRIPNGSL